MSIFPAQVLRYSLSFGPMSTWMIWGLQSRGRRGVGIKSRLQVVGQIPAEDLIPSMLEDCIPCGVQMVC